MIVSLVGAARQGGWVDETEECEELGVTVTFSSYLLEEGSRVTYFFPTSMSAHQAGHLDFWAPVSGAHNARDLNS